MSLNIANAPTAPSAPAEAVRRVLMHNVSWDRYEKLLAAIGDSPVRLTYDEGRLEIMSPLPVHEHFKKVIARLIEAYADAAGMDVEGLGSTTYRRKDLARGLEPDECYYIANAKAILGREQLDLTRDPVPDLAIEIDIHPPDIARQPLYAALGVPEVWRYDGRLAFLRRRDESGYEPVSRSLSFPDLPLERMNEWIEIGLNAGQSAAVRAMRQWLAAGSA